MKLKLLVGGAACAMVLAGSSLSAQAAIGGAANQLGAAARQQSSVDSVAYRNCWWRHGVRHCRYYRGYGYTGPHLPEAYRTGSTRWWQEMDRQDRGGRGRR